MQITALSGLQEAARMRSASILGTLGAAAAAMGSGAAMLWPDKKWIGITFIVTGLCLLAKAVYEWRSRKGADDPKAVSSQSVPDYDAWEIRDELTLWEVACLWAGIESRPDVPEGRVSVYLRLLRIAVSRGELHPVGTIVAMPSMRLSMQGYRFDPDRIRADVLLKRTQLVRYARKRGENPLFLFKRRWRLLGLTTRR